MSTNVQRHDITPPPAPLDEGYWASLLKEGEFSEPVQVSPDKSNDRGNLHSDYPNGDYISHENQDSTDRDWQEIQRIMQNDQAIELTVIGYNRGGLLVEWRTLRGFVPASQLVDFPATSNTIIRRNSLMNRVGQQLELRVIELNAEQNRLILSERAARVAPGERADILLRLRPGDIVNGHVTNLCDFGAFVDLGGLEGLIHISELSWGRVGHPSDVLQRGQEVEVYVLDIDRKANRIALSLKRLYPDPWETVTHRYCIGQIVRGTVTNVVDFGALRVSKKDLRGLFMSPNWPKAIFCIHEMSSTRGRKLKHVF